MPSSKSSVSQVQNSRFTRRNLILCGNCWLQCDSSSLYMKCSVCQKNFHHKCKNIFKKHATELAQNDFSYICSDKCYLSLLPFAFSNDINFFSAIFGEGEFPCSKCHKDCLEYSPCIECSICGLWTHYECSKLNAYEFNTNPYFFCKADE